ncbi:MAG: TIGR03905 family TSCPD domain-containing protein [Clostridia bacterium]|nr:TIGR03905 family TSCPD domain-containing protein [Clostridia bacterium]
MIYTFKPKGVCPAEIRIELDEDNIIRGINAVGGCSGNLQGISVLAEGMSASEAVKRLKGIRCSFKQTSCPDQIAQALEEFLSEKAEQI